MTEMTDDTTTNAPTVDLAGKMFFHLVAAEVVYQTKRGGVAVQRTQFMTQSPEDKFTAARIHQLQNSAAATVREKLTGRQAEGFGVHDVLFLSITPCGLMTNNEFYGPGMTAEADLKKADAAPGFDVQEPAAEPVAADETASTDNVVQLKPKD